MGPDVTYIHCTTFTEQAWMRVATSGGHVSLAAPIGVDLARVGREAQASRDFIVSSAGWRRTLLGDAPG